MGRIGSIGGNPEILYECTPATATEFGNCTFRQECSIGCRRVAPAGVVFKDFCATTGPNPVAVSRNYTISGDRVPATLVTEAPVEAFSALSWTTWQRWVPPGRTGVPCILRDGPGVLHRLHRCEHQGMLALFAPAQSVPPVGMQRLAVGRMGTQTVCGHDQSAMRVGCAPLGKAACGGVACTSLGGRAVGVDHGFWHQRPHGARVRRPPRGAQHLRPRGDRPMAVDVAQTRGAGPGLGGTSGCPNLLP